jgi:broad specificity phosphatase PhoE
MQMLTTLDSVFVDSPLSQLGAQQAIDVQKFIESMPESDAIGSVLKGAPGSSSVLVASNLRRAISTSLIAFMQRVRRTQEKVHILSALQEITFNIDGVSLAKPRAPPVLADVELSAMNQSRKDFNPDRYFDCSGNNGDKPMRGKGLTRLLQFAKWAMDRPEEHVIAAGHSLYFRFFFQTFLPQSSVHIAKKDKMGNGCIVAFTLYEGLDPSGQLFYGVDESTVKVVYHDFESRLKHDKKKDE